MHKALTILNHSEASEVLHCSWLQLCQSCSTCSINISLIPPVMLNNSHLLNVPGKNCLCMQQSDTQMIIVNIGTYTTSHVCMVRMSIEHINIGVFDHHMCSHPTDVYRGHVQTSYVACSHFMLIGIMHWSSSTECTICIMYSFFE